MRSARLDQMHVAVLLSPDRSMTGGDAILAIAALVIIACVIATAVIFGGIREANAALNDDATEGADWGGEHLHNDNAGAA